MKKFSIKPPRFVSTKDELYYYDVLLSVLEESNTALQDQDAIGLGTFAINLALLDTCTESIIKDGMHVSVQGDRNMVRKVNPAIALQKEAQTAIRFWTKEFQMSPNSRGSGSLGGAGVKKPKGDRFEEI